MFEVSAIVPVCAASAAATQARLHAKAKPPESLGRLEELAVRLSAAQASSPPASTPARVLVFAADHGVVAEAVSPYPQAVTAAMVRAFCTGGAAVAVLARQAGASLEVIDVGVAAEMTAVAGSSLVLASVAKGTGNIAREPAMTLAQARQAVAAGADAATRAAKAGCRLLAVGEMGIGNTTAAAALAARLLDRPASAVVGPGTGLDAAGVARKISVVERALARSSAARADIAAVLADLGGFDHAAMVGAYLGAAARRLPVLVDGFIASVAALAAIRYAPSARGYLIPATLSTEPGHQAVLAALDLGPPLLNLELRLGEASGAALALPLASAACAIVSEMTTLAAIMEGA